MYKFFCLFDMGTTKRMIVHHKKNGSSLPPMTGNGVLESLGLGLGVEDDFFFAKLGLSPPPLLLPL